jgi:hypothetical protein
MSFTTCSSLLWYVVMPDDSLCDTIANESQLSPGHHVMLHLGMYKATRCIWSTQAHAATTASAVQA